MRLGFRRELVHPQAKNADFGQLVRYFGRVTAPESAPGLDSVVSPIFSENEINFEVGSASVPFVPAHGYLVPARIIGHATSELHRKTNFNGSIASS